jgi:cytochrome b561
MATTFSARLGTSSVPRYTHAAIALHWLMALLIVCNFCLGLYMSDLPFSPTRAHLFNYHKWTGITILALAALRLLWRLTHKPPPPLPSPRWQHLAAEVVHWGIYLLFFAVPLTGWAYSSAAGFPISWFGVLPLPDFVPKDRALAGALKEVHETLAWVLAGFVAVHFAGAMKHAIIDRDGLLKRMQPGRA